MKTAVAFGPAGATPPQEPLELAGVRDTGEPAHATLAAQSTVSGTRRTFARLPDQDGANNWRPVEKSARLATGKQIPGTRYRLRNWLGEGGMGEVFEAVHVDIERRVALKIVKRGTSEELCHQFITEARTIAKIESRFVVDVLDFGELPDGRPFYSMELLRDYSLHTMLEEEGRLSLERALPILRQLCKALTAIHACGLAHRDLKPENIMLQPDAGRPDMVRVVDFGISAEFGPHAVQIAGTPLYMAPEQFMGEAFDARLDIYAFGCLAYELISGAPPFVGEPKEIFEQHLRAHPDSLTGRWPELPEELDEVLTRCLAKQPGDRFANAIDLEAALCEIQIAAGFTTPWDDLALPEVNSERREQLALEMPTRRSTSSVEGRIAMGVALAALLGALVWVVWPSGTDAGTVDGVEDGRAWVEDYAAEARAAAAQAYWVYPPASDREFKTAQAWVKAIEDRAGLGDYIAQAEASRLNSEFAATLNRLGDDYWDEEHGRPFAVEFYAQALIFDPGNAHASERVALTEAQLADVGARAARGEFSDAELATGEMLAALAEPDKKTRRDRVVSLMQDDERQVGGAHTRDMLMDLIGADEAKAEVEEAAEAGATPEGLESAGGSGADTKRARELADQGRKALAKGKRDKAGRLFHKAIEADDHNLSAVSGLAQIHFDRGSYGQALSFAKKAARLRPRDRDVRLLLGDTYLKVLRYSEARIEYQKARELGHPLASKREARLDELTK